MNATIGVNMCDCGDKDCRYKESKLSWHEALHTASLATDFFFDNVEKHPAVQHDRGLKETAEKITQAMAEFYQAVGRKSFSYDERLLGSITCG